MALSLGMILHAPSALPSPGFGDAGEGFRVLALELRFAALGTEGIRVFGRNHR